MQFWRGSGNNSIGVAKRGPGGPRPPKYLAYLVILCFEKQRSKQKHCCSPTIKHFGFPKFFTSYATEQQTFIITKKSRTLITRKVQSSRSSSALWQPRQQHCNTSPNEISWKGKSRKSCHKPPRWQRSAAAEVTFARYWLGKTAYKIYFQQNGLLCALARPVFMTKRKRKVEKGKPSHSTGKMWRQRNHF